MKKSRSSEKDGLLHEVILVENSVSIIEDKAEDCKPTTGAKSDRERDYEIDQNIGLI